MFTGLEVPEHTVELPRDVLAGELTAETVENAARKRVLDIEFDSRTDPLFGDIEPVRTAHRAREFECSLAVGLGSFRL
jgi:hypothetical protein